MEWKKMNFIPLTQQNDTEVQVNMDNVTSFIPAKSGTILRFNGGNPPAVQVTEELKDVLKRMAKITGQRKSV